MIIPTLIVPSNSKFDNCGLELRDFRLSVYFVLYFDVLLNHLR